MYNVGVGVYALCESMDVWTYGWTGGRTGGRTEECMDVCTFLSILTFLFVIGMNLTLSYLHCRS